MNENIVELLNVAEQSYKGKYLEALLEGSEYLEETNLSELHKQWVETTRELLFKLQKVALRNELFESSDEIQALLDNSK